MVMRSVLTQTAVLVALVIGAVVASSPASAATVNTGFDHNGGSPDINAGPILVAAGGNVEVPLVIQTESGAVGAFSLDVYFDETVVDATGCTSVYGACNPDPVFASNAARVNGANPAGIAGTVGTITFHATGAPGQCSTLEILLDELVDPLEQVIPGITTNGQICITGPTCADLNGDDRVDLRDAARLLLHILLRRPYNPALDLNGDGVINGRDLGILARQIGTTC